MAMKREATMSETCAALQDLPAQAAQYRPTGIVNLDIELLEQWVEWLQDEDVDRVVADILEVVDAVRAP